MKVYERLMDARIRKQVDVDAMQCGFMPGKGTTDRQLSKKKDLYFAFIDLEKAFDRVPREVVRWELREAGVDEWPVGAVMAENAKIVMRTSSGETESFELKVSVHQGSGHSPLLTRRCKKGLPWEVLYTDDLGVMADSEAELRRMIAAWKESLSGKGLKVNTNKSQVMVSTASQSPTETRNFPCSVCSKGVGANSLVCTRCRWCSGITGNLQAVSADFKCKRCMEILLNFIISNLSKLVCGS